MTIPFPGGTYRARCTRVVDGDTVDLVADLGFRVSVAGRFRLLGINAPEMHDHDLAKRNAAIQARAQVEAWLTVDGDWPLLVDGLRPDPDDFGRWLARIHVLDICVNDELVRLGLAEVYRP